jgi:hypothetical protein
LRLFFFENQPFGLIQDDCNHGHNDDCNHGHNNKQIHLLTRNLTSIKSYPQNNEKNQHSCIPDRPGTDCNYINNFFYQRKSGRFGKNRNQQGKTSACKSGRQ